MLSLQMNNINIFLDTLLCHCEHTHTPQYHTQANAFPSQQELNNNWTKVSHTRGRSAQYETETKAKHSKEDEHRLNQISTSNRYTALLEQESEDQQHKTGPETSQNILQFM
jgi:hypothetical protein